jgi:multicomponent Na+:H+ antiporter subunit B
MYSLILSTATRLLLPLMLIFSFFLLLRGHNLPGGGFVGGLIAATAFVLFALSDGLEKARKSLIFDTKTYIPIGLTIALVSGLVGLFAGQPFMAGAWLKDPVPVLGKIGTPVIFDIGVYFLVFGITLTIMFTLMEQND